MSGTVHASQDFTHRELLAWVGFLRVNAALERDLDSALNTAHGISLSDYDVMVNLASAPGQRMRMSEISESVLISQSGITRLVDRLVQRGLARREKAPNDRRGFFAVLTPKGRETVRRASVTHTADVKRRFLEHLSEEEQEILGRVWKRLLPGMAEAVSPLLGRSAD